MPYNQDPYGDPRGRRDNRDRARRVDSQRDGAAYRQTRDGYAAARPRTSRPAAFEGQRYGAPSPRPRRPDARPSGPTRRAPTPSVRPRARDGRTPADGCPAREPRRRVPTTSPALAPAPPPGRPPRVGGAAMTPSLGYASQPRDRGSARGRRSGGNRLAGGMAVLASGITGGTRSSGSQPPPVRAVGRPQRHRWHRRRGSGRHHRRAAVVKPQGGHHVERRGHEHPRGQHLRGGHPDGRALAQGRATSSLSLASACRKGRATPTRPSSTATSCPRMTPRTTASLPATASTSPTAETAWRTTTSRS